MFLIIFFLFTYVNSTGIKYIDWDQGIDFEVAVEDASSLEEEQNEELRQVQSNSDIFKQQVDLSFIYICNFHVLNHFFILKYVLEFAGGQP
jgi:hypothetical protein